MYIGSTDTRGLMHCLWEIIDNGVDEALAGAAHHVEVTLHPDDSVEVHDDGRGIPTDKEPKTGLPGVEVVATKLHAGGKFGGGSYVATGGLHGVGLSVVNALSSRMDIDVDRSPTQQGISFKRGVPGVFDGDGPDGVVHAEVRADPQGRPGRQGPGPAPGSGSGPTGRSSPRTPTFEFEGLLGRAQQTAFIVPGLELVIRDLRGPEMREEKFRHDGGIAEFAEFLAHDEPVTEILRLQGKDTFTETVPVLDAKGHMTPQEVERELDVDIAVRWGTGYETELRSFVNVIATPKGGTHVSGFEQALLEHLQRRHEGRPGAQGQRRRRASRTTSSRGSPPWSRSGWPSRSSRARPRRSSAPPQVAGRRFARSSRASSRSSSPRPSGPRRPRPSW